MPEAEKTPWTSHGTHVRTEPGPALKRARASEKTLGNDVTAPHYQAGARDAMGREIAHEQDFHYLDYLNDPVHYVYHLQDVEVTDAGGNVVRDDKGEPQTEERWVEVGVYPDADAATDQAKKLQASLGAPKAAG